MRYFKYLINCFPIYVNMCRAYHFSQGTITLSKHKITCYKLPGAGGMQTVYRLVAASKIRG